MKLSRIVKWDVNGQFLDETKKAVEQLPEKVLGNKSIEIGRYEKDGNSIFTLNPEGHLFYLELPEGLSNITIYRINENPRREGNGRVTFNCGDYHYEIPSLNE